MRDDYTGPIVENLLSDPTLRPLCRSLQAAGVKGCITVTFAGGWKPLRGRVGIFHGLGSKKTVNSAKHDRAVQHNVSCKAN